MSTPDTKPVTSTSGTPRRLPTEAVVALVGIAVAMLAMGVVAGYRLAGPGSPSNTSPEAGFARDMQTHHNQAVQMALIIRDKTTDPTLRAVSYDIITSQAQQSGQMYGWLTQWRLPQTSTEPPMAWMATRSSANPGGHDMAAMPSGATTASTDAPARGSMLLPDGRMPGMASPTDLTALQAATGRDAEIRFLKLMISHHQAGITMARTIQTLTDRPDVLTLATSIASAQAAEIDQLKTLLAAKGG